MSKAQRKIKEFQRKYQFALDCDLIPYEYILETIKEVTDDLCLIKSIILTNREIVNACEILIKKLIDILEYFKIKLEQFLDIELVLKRV